MKKVIITAILLFILSIVYLQAKFINSVAIGFSNFNQIEKNIYIDNSFKKIEIQNIKSLLINAKKRIEDKFGKLISNPVIIICKTKEKSLKYGNSVGLAYISPINNYVVIGYKGLNIDVIAHELLHAETAYRLGYITRQFKFPIWIDEGISMQVDYRKKYNVDILSDSEIKRIQTLNSVNLFFSNEKQQLIKNYQGSKYVVAKILRQYPDKNLFTLLQEIKNGKSIEELFSIKTDKTHL